MGKTRQDRLKIYETALHTLTCQNLSVTRTLEEGGTRNQLSTSSTYTFYLRM